MKEIRLHGRGGQGAVTAAKILASAFVLEGKYATAFPMYATERRGAPVAAFLRIDDRPIRQRTQIYQPDGLVVLNPDLLRVANVFSGLSRSGFLIRNATDQDEPMQAPRAKMIGSIDANKVSLEEIGRSITNTCMLGAFARTTGWIELDSILSVLDNYLAIHLLEQNRRCVQRGFHETEVIDYGF